MKRIFSIIFLLFLCFHTSLMAQRTMNTLNNQFGSSANGLDRNQYDRNGNPIDTTAVVDANTIPIGLYSWKVDSRFGNVTYIPVDTLQHAFQNSNDTVSYTHLRAHETGRNLVCRLLLEKKKKHTKKKTK